MSRSGGFRCAQEATGVSSAAGRIRVEGAGGHSHDGARLGLFWKDSQSSQARDDGLCPNLLLSTPVFRTRCKVYGARRCISHTHTRARESSSSCAANPLKRQPHGRHVDCSMRFASTLCPSCHSRHPRPFGARSVHLEATANPIVGGSKTPPPPSVRTSSQYTVSTRSYATLLSQIRPPACVCTLRKPAQRGRSVPFSCTVREAAVLNVALVPFAFAFSFARARVAKAHSLLHSLTVAHTFTQCTTAT